MNQGKLEVVKQVTPVLWPPHAKSWLIGKDSDAGRDWGQEEKGMTEDEMAGWHHRLNGHELGWTPRVDDGQGGLTCCNSWGRKGSDTTEQLNWTELNILSILISKILVFNQIIWSIHLPSHHYYYYYYYCYLIKDKVNILKDEVNCSKMYLFF